MEPLLKSPLDSPASGFTIAKAVLALVTLIAGAGTTHAVLVSNFNEAGTTVNGYQDDFNGTTLNPDWLLFDGGGNGPDMFMLSGNGTLMMNPAALDPNKLLYNPAVPYNDSVQQILALIRLTTDPPGDSDGTRGGVNVGSNVFDGQGINLHFREPNRNGPGNHFNLLDDLRAWGPNTDPNLGGDTWTEGSYKWLRLVQDANGTDFAKIWDAGTTPEPADFDLSWSGRGRTGLAGLTTNSLGGQAVFEVDYVLIQADGLPSIKVAVPEPASALLLGLAGTMLGLRRRCNG
jgi:hypothetical protein